MRTYADLHLCPPLDDASNAQTMASLLVELKTSLIGLALPPGRLGRMPTAHEVFRSAGIDTARRLNLRPHSRNDLLRDLRKYRNQYEIIAVECNSLLVSQVAVRDRRVDIVHFSRTRRRNVFRPSLAKACRATLEIDIGELISNIGSGAFLLGLRRDIETVIEASTPIVGSTGASKPLDLRSPRDMAAILNVIGLPLGNALDAVSDVPINLVKRNRSKLNEPQLEQGVRLLGRLSKSV